MRLEKGKRKKKSRIHCPFLLRPDEDAESGKGGKGDRAVRWSPYDSVEKKSAAHRGKTKDKKKRETQVKRKEEGAILPSQTRKEGGNVHGIRGEMKSPFRR